MPPHFRLALTVALGLSLAPGCTTRCADTCLDESDAGTGAGSADAATDAELPELGAPDASPGDASLDDAGPPGDAFTPDDAAADAAPSSDASAPDDAATAGDAGVPCDPTRIRFLPSGTLMEGRLCDDVFACVPTRADADALEAAAPLFDCTIPPEGACSGISCVMRPSLLDAAEVAQICAATTLPALTDLVCFVYL